MLDYWRLTSLRLVKPTLNRYIDYLQELIRKESVIHMDETPFKVIDEPNETGYF